MEDRVEALGEIARDIVRQMVREVVARKPGGHLVEGDLGDLELRLPLAIKGPGADPALFTARLVEAIERTLGDAMQAAAAFRPGHTYCLRCRGPVCEHSQPPSGRHVFVGYAPTGAPRWEDFAQHCLDLRHPDVDRLYEERPAFLTLAATGDALRSSLLEAFDTPSYELVGQVTAGFFPIPVRIGEGRGVVAITFQVAASRPRDGRPRLGLNILGRSPAGEDLESLWDRQRDLPWRRAVRWAQWALQSVRLPRVPAGSRTALTVRGSAALRAEGILRGLARRLERDHRGRGRRTSHAERRHESGSRPTRKAYDDVLSAGADDVLIDDRSRTWVVLGNRGRTHFFTTDGRLVSSVRYSRDAIARKRKTGLWRDASNGEVETLRATVADGEGSPISGAKG